MRTSAFHRLSDTIGTFDLADGCLPEATNRVITLDGRLVGSIASFVIDGDAEVTYWIDRSFWGQGIASRALALLLESVHVRPLFARAASDNAGSLKVLQRAGFAITGTVLFVAGLVVHARADRTLAGCGRPARPATAFRTEAPSAGSAARTTPARSCGSDGRWRPGLRRGSAFAVYTTANLAPRAIDHHAWYRERFPDYPADRRALVPHLL